MDNMTEQSRYQEIVNNLISGEEAENKFVFNHADKTLKPVIPSDDPEGVMEYTPEDLILSGAQNDLYKKRSTILLSGKILSEIFSKPALYKIFLKCMDDGDVYSLLTLGNKDKFTPCSLYVSPDDNSSTSPNKFGSSDDHIRISITKSDNAHINEKDFKHIHGFIRRKDGWQEIPVNIIPVEKELYSRHGGLIETNVILEKKIVIIALGSVGSVVAVELAKAGAGYFVLIEPDRLEVANISRHAAGLSDVGRYKVNAVADLILNINPHARIKKIIKKVDWDNIGELRKVIKKADMVFCSPDAREPRLIVNRICVEENKVCIFGGCSERAYKCQILCVNPLKNSFCYQCFIGMIRDITEDIAVPSDDVNNPAYSDRPVKIEPGLNNDIAPVNIMSVKLIIQYLLKDTPTTFRSLDEDLIASLYIWLNRREKSTLYENLKPLGFDINGFKILRWYGIDVERDPHCWVCGHQGCGDFKC